MHRLFSACLLATAACAPAPPASAPPAQRVSAPVPAPSAAAKVVSSRATLERIHAPPAALAPPHTGCRFVPSTVYGQEAPRLDVAATATSPAPGVLRDEHGVALFEESVRPPQSYRLQTAESGDFTFELGPGERCAVTINRELARAPGTP